MSDSSPTREAGRSNPPHEIEQNQPEGSSRKGMPWSSEEVDLLLKLRKDESRPWSEVTRLFWEQYPGRSSGAMQVFWSESQQESRLQVTLQTMIFIGNLNHLQTKRTSKKYVFLSINNSIDAISFGLSATEQRPPNGRSLRYMPQWCGPLPLKYKDDQIADLQLRLQISTINTGRCPLLIPISA